MNLHTEKEFIFGSEYFLYRLKKLFNDDKKLFYQVADYIPNIIYMSKELGYENQKSAYLYYNTNNAIYRAPEIQELMNVGLTLLPKLSCPVLLQTVKEKALIYKKNDDKDTSVKYFQRLTANNKHTYVLTHKTFTNEENLFLNFSDRIIDLPYIGKTFNDVFEYYHKDFKTWQLFKSLTKQERKVIKLICESYSNKQIAEQLIISENTVKTHRKNIYRKLNIKNISHLVNVAIILDLEA